MREAVTVTAPATSSRPAGDCPRPPGRTRREGEDSSPDGNVDEEDPVPAERVREDSAEQDTDCPAARGYEAEHAHRLGPLGRLGEERHDQGEGDRGDDGSAEALDRARSDKEALRRRETAAERSEREERDAQEEEPLMAEEIPQPPGEEEEAAEREQVGVRDPGERALREAEILSDRRERNPHDRHVQDDHEVTEADDH
jgi:hypothetical protein